MKDLLEVYFGQHYRSPKRVRVACRKCCGQFDSVDTKACLDCRKHTPDEESACDKIVLKCFSSDKGVEKIELESFLDNYANLQDVQKKSRCDLLFVGDDKIVFCDMTCSRAKYIEMFNRKDGTVQMGKRNIARKQLTGSISLLMNVPEIAGEISVKSQKVALFAYREKESELNDDLDKMTLRRMRSFIGIDRSGAIDNLMYSDIGYGFLFAEVKYPQIYIW